MKKTKLFLVATTAIMLIMTSCSGAFVDPGMQDNNNSIGGRGTSSPSYDDGYDDGYDYDDYHSGGGKSSSSGKTSPSVDCSSYQSDYNRAKSIVEQWERTVASSQSSYDFLKNNNASSTSISSALSTLTQAKNSLTKAKSDLSDVQRQAASAGCSVY